MSWRSFQSHPLSCQTIKHQTWHGKTRSNYVEYHLDSPQKRSLPRVLLRNFNGAVRRRQLFTDVCIITFSSDDAPSQTEAWLYSNTCSFECLKECTTSIIITCSFSDTATWSWNINQECVFPFHAHTLPAPQTPKCFPEKSQRCSRSLWGNIQLIMQEPQLE